LQVGSETLLRLGIERAHLLHRNDRLHALRECVGAGGCAACWSAIGAGVLAFGRRQGACDEGAGILRGIVLEALERENALATQPATQSRRQRQA